MAVSCAPLSECPHRGVPFILQGTDGRRHFPRPQPVPQCRQLVAELGRYPFRHGTKAPGQVVAVTRAMG
jgi:hypothetical protein